MTRAMAIRRTFQKGRPSFTSYRLFIAAMTETMALEEAQSASRIPMESSPSFLFMNRARMLSWISANAWPGRNLAAFFSRYSSRSGMGT